MFSRLLFYKSDTFNPYENLATEKYLFDILDENTLIIYLWQNDNTVVIGKNQNPWAECNCELLKAEGGFVARRMSGGGAVFHDKGNLNFTFICSEDNFNLESNFNIIRKACEYAGFNAELSGRNDILVGGKKFSGNAFYHANKKAYHHGTILISGNAEKLKRYLTPDAEKLTAKGVKSVKSRVINLSEIKADLTPEIFSEYILKAAEEILNLKVQKIKEISKEAVKEQEKFFSSWDFIYGKTLPFSISFGKRFDFGNIQINMNLKNGKIDDIKVYTDALDFTLTEKIETALAGCEFKVSAIENHLQKTLSANIISAIIKTLMQ